MSPMAPRPSIELLESCVGDSEDVDGVVGPSVLAFSHLPAVQPLTICPRQIERDRAHLGAVAPAPIRLLIPLTAPSSRNTPTISARPGPPCVLPHGINQADFFSVSQLLPLEW